MPVFRINRNTIFHFTGLCIFLFYISVLNAQQKSTVHVQGKVIDASNGEAIVGANVIYEPLKGLTTDINGEFSFVATKINLTISISCIGYQNATKRVESIDHDSIFITIPMDPSVTAMDEVVVTASKTEEKSSELTVSIAAINPVTIARDHTTRVDGIIGKIPGIEILDGQASIRGGSGYSYGAGSRVLVLVNSLPALSADAGNVKWHYLPVENVSKIEIIKGASSVMYGSSALNGVINIRTTGNIDQPQTKVYVQSGIYSPPANHAWKWWDTPRLSTNLAFHHGQQIKNTGISFSAFALDENSYRKGNDKSVARVNLQLEQKSKKFEDLVYGLHLNAMVSRKTEFILWENADSGALVQNNQTVLEQEGSSFSIDPYISYKGNGRFSHEFISRFEETFNNYPEKSNNNSYYFSAYGEYRTGIKIISGLRFFSGISQNYHTIISPFYGNHKGINIAAYGQLNFYPGRRIKIVSGVRLEHFNLNDTDKAVKPVFRAGVNYRAFDYTFLRASFGQGYRYPSIAEKYARTTVGAIKIFPNGEIKPETGWNSEIGIKQGIKIFNMNGQLDAACFYSQFNNMIEYAFVAPNPLENIPEFGFKALNLENARVYGFDGEIFLQAGIKKAKLNLNPGYTFTYPAEYNQITGENTGTFLKYRSKHSFKTNLVMEMNKSEIGLFVVSKSKTLNIDKVFLLPGTREEFLPGFYDYYNVNNKGYAVFDVFISRDILPRLKISASIKNLFNKEYMGRPGDIRPPRFISFKLEYYSNSNSATTGK